MPLDKYGLVEFLSCKKLCLSEETRRNLAFKVYRFLICINLTYSLRESFLIIEDSIEVIVLVCLIYLLLRTESKIEVKIYPKRSSSFVVQLF